MKREDIDLERGDDDIAFVTLGDDLDSSEILEEAEKPRKRIEKELGRKGLEWENARIAAIFRDEISLHLEENSRIYLNGEAISDDG